MVNYLWIYSWKLLSSKMEWPKLISRKYPTILNIPRTSCVAFGVIQQSNREPLTVHVATEILQWDYSPVIHHLVTLCNWVDSFCLMLGFLAKCISDVFQSLLLSSLGLSHCNFWMFQKLKWLLKLCGWV